jgi:hypothetical protein
METYSLRDAAKLCGVSLTAMRSRADRGSIKTDMRGAQRRVARSELERTGLLPDAEIRALRQQIADLQHQLFEHRRLVADTERERAAIKRQIQAEAEGYQRVVEAANRERARRAEFESKLHRLENQLAAGGPIKAWRLGLQIKRARPDLVTPGQRLRRGLASAAVRLRKSGPTRFVGLRDASGPWRRRPGTRPSPRAGSRILRGCAPRPPVRRPARPCRAPSSRASPAPDNALMTSGSQRLVSGGPSAAENRDRSWLAESDDTRFSSSRTSLVSSCVSQGERAEAEHQPDPREHEQETALADLARGGLGARVERERRYGEEEDREGDEKIGGELADQRRDGGGGHGCHERLRADDVSQLLAQVGARGSGHSVPTIPPCGSAEGELRHYVGAALASSDCNAPRKQPARAPGSVGHLGDVRRRVPNRVPNSANLTPPRRTQPNQNTSKQTQNPCK